MTNRADQDRDDLLAGIQDDWRSLGTCTEPADRSQAELASREACASNGVDVASQVRIWVQSPLAGVLASTFVGFALGEQLTPRIMTPLEMTLRADVPAAQTVRRAVDGAVWPLRRAVHQQVAAELTVRGPAFERLKVDIGNYAWDQVWQAVGDPVYSQAWEHQAQVADGLFEENLTPWAEAMMEGQFGAGMMAQLDALATLGLADPEPFTGIRRAARSCCWWWPYHAGAIFCERPARCEFSDDHVTIEFRDGWTVSA